MAKWRNQKYFSTWQSRAWETGKSGMSYINKNSFSRWIIEKLEGLTTLGLQKLSETVRDYMYLILTSQTSTRGPIIGHEARNLDAQRVFLNTFENRMYTQKKNYILQLKVSRFHDHQAIHQVLPDDRENVKLLVAKCSFSSVYTSYVLLYFTY